MNLVFFLSIALSILLVDMYFYRAVKVYISSLKNNKLRIISTLFYWLITLLSILFLAYASTFINGKPAPKIARVYIFGTMLIFLMCKMAASIWLILNDIYRLINWITKKTFNKSAYSSSRRDFIKKSAVLTAAIPFASLVFGMIKTAFDYEIKKSKLKIPGLPKNFKGLKIVHISDIHTGSFITSNPLKEAVDMIAKEKPDLVFFTGDLVNDIAEEALPFIDTLKGITAKYGIYAVLGNHDYGDYHYSKENIEGKKHNKELINKIYKQLGWKLLLNENEIIKLNNERLAILGVENWGNQGRFPKYGDIDLAKKGTLKSDVKLLLSHDPSHWEAKVVNIHNDIACTFSGHTHGMQLGIEIPGIKWSPSQYFYKQWAGLYKKGKQQIYVNRGLGFLGYPGRLGINPEITVLELT